MRSETGPARVPEVLLGARTFAVFDASKPAAPDGELVDLRDEFFEQEDSLLDLF